MDLVLRLTVYIALRLVLPALAVILSAQVGQLPRILPLVQRLEIIECLQLPPDACRVRVRVSGVDVIICQEIGVEGEEAEMFVDALNPSAWSAHQHWWWEGIGEGVVLPVGFQVIRPLNKPTSSSSVQRSSKASLLLGDADAAASAAGVRGWEVVVGEVALEVRARLRGGMAMMIFRN